jgi:proteasome lid subunit RPN8/RPN11
MRRWALLAYGLGIAVLSAGYLLRAERPRTPVHSLDRARQRGEVAPNVPRLDANDAMANAALLNALLSEVPHPGFPRDGQTCEARARSLAVQLRGRLSRVRFGARSVCQLRRLKAISVAQPGFGPRGVAEVAAFVLGRRLQGPATSDAIVDVDVSRIVVPPFRFGDATLTFTAADLGPLQPGELFIGTYHTHPEGDITQGVLSETDIDYMRQAILEFGGELLGETPAVVDLSANQPTDAARAGPTRAAASGSPEIAAAPLPRSLPRSDWLFDIVDPKEGDWNVYAHDAARLSELSALCRTRPPCPLNELRIAGSRFHLLARVYEEQDDDTP